MQIIKNLICQNHTRLKRSQDDIVWIVLHHDDSMKSAEELSEYYKRNESPVSADFYVGTAGEVWQGNDYWNYYSWGMEAGISGDGPHPFYKQAVNKNSLNIVLCAERREEDGTDILFFEEATINTAAELTAHLMKELNIDISHVIRHYDVNAGECPAPFVCREGFNDWESFKDRIMGFYHTADTGIVYKRPERQAEKNAFLYVSGHEGGAGGTGSPVAGEKGLADSEKSGSIEILEGQLREMYASVCLNQKMQEKQSDIYNRRNEFLQTANILLSAVTSAGIISVIFANEFFLKLITAVISMVSTGISTYFKTFDLSAMAQGHKHAAASLLDIRSRLISLLCDIKMRRLDEQAVVEKRDVLLAELEETLGSAEEVSEEAMRKARSAIDSKNEYSISDEEIEKLLPEYLRSVRKA